LDGVPKLSEKTRQAFAQTREEHQKQGRFIKLQPGDVKHSIPEQKVKVVGPGCILCDTKDFTLGQLKKKQVEATLN
jgi:hypothetical protein